MARSTPTYTPPGKYVLAGIISTVLLISDLSYQTFNSVRQMTQASGIYTQLILGDIYEYTSQFTIIYQDKKDLVATNKKLSNELLFIQNKVFLDQQSRLTSKKILDVKKQLESGFDEELVQSFRVTSFDLKNYLCCSSHTLYLKNPNKLDVASNLPVSNGQTFIGQTSGNSLGLVKVILLSDASHILPIRIKNLYCNALGAGRPQIIKCLAPKQSQSSSLKVNDLVFTSGLGGVFPSNVVVGRITSVINNNLGEREIFIGLNGDPLKQNYFGIPLSL